VTNNTREWVGYTVWYSHPQSYKEGRWLL